MSWAEDAAARAAREEEKETLRMKRDERESKIKDGLGPELFVQLIDWLADQVERYNKARDKQELAVSATKLQLPSSDKSIKVFRRDGTQQPITFTYDSTVHRLRCECGAGNREFILRIGPDGVARFETPYNQAKTVEDIGTEMLKLFEHSQF
jgi:hypothetical protein